MASVDIRYARSVFSDFLAIRVYKEIFDSVEVIILSFSIHPTASLAARVRMRTSLAVFLLRRSAADRLLMKRAAHVNPFQPDASAVTSGLWQAMTSGLYWLKRN